MAVSPAYVTLVADTDATVTLDSNYGQVEVALVANAANTWFNALGNTVPAVASAQDGNHVLTTTLLAKVIRDQSPGNVTVVHLRSSGTPTVSVLGL